MDKSVIKIKNLTKDFGHNKGNFNINFEIKQGEVFGFLGPNGAGKTTTIRQLMGFMKPDSGECLINNLDCFKFADEIQKNIGYIPGEIAFMDDLTGIEFIHFMADYRGLKNLDKANELIKLFEFDPTSKIKKMSKGMKQKLGIVTAFMHEPDILILDEPTSGLDPLMQNIFIKLISDEKKNGKTILMSSHIFEEVEKTADKIAIIKNGKIKTIDTIQNLKKDKFKKYIVTFKNKKEILELKKDKLECENIFDNKVTIIVKNNINDFIKVLNKYEIVDIEEIKQGLEEIFLNYYGEDQND